MDKYKPIIRNGFPLVTRWGIESFTAISMDEVWTMRTLFATIKRLAPDDEQIQGLAKHGYNLAESVHNDIDVFRECAEKAGLAGELVDEETSKGSRHE